MEFGVAENRNLHFTYFGYVSVFMWIGILSYHVAHAMTLTPFQTNWFFQNTPTSRDRNRKFTKSTSTSTSNTYIWSNIVCCWFFRWFFLSFLSWLYRLHVASVCMLYMYVYPKPTYEKEKEQILTTQPKQSTELKLYIHTKKTTTNQR